MCGGSYGGSSAPRAVDDLAQAGADGAAHLTLAWIPVHRRDVMVANRPVRREHHTISTPIRGNKKK
jgi:hypothetical protein